MIELRDMTSDESNIISRAYARPLQSVIFRETLSSDVAYAAFSVTFVLFYIWFHLSSFWMAITSMILILLSFPVSYFIYTGLF